MSNIVRDHVNKRLKTPINRRIIITNNFFNSPDEKEFKQSYSSKRNKNYQLVELKREELQF